MNAALWRGFAGASTFFSGTVTPTQLRLGNLELRMSGEKGAIFTAGSFWQPELARAKPTGPYHNADSGQSARFVADGAGWPREGRGGAAGPSAAVVADFGEPSG